MNEEENTRPSNPPPESDPHPAVLAAERFAHLVGVLLEPVRDELKQLRENLAAHQVEEVEHHRAVDTGLRILVEHRQVQDRRITLLEERVAALELADTQPPEAAE